MMEISKLFIGVVLLSLFTMVVIQFQGNLSDRYSIETSENFTVIEEAYISINETQTDLKEEIETASSNPVDGFLAAINIALTIGKQIINMINIIPGISGVLAGVFGMGYVAPYVEIIIYLSIVFLVISMILRWKM